MPGSQIDAYLNYLLETDSDTYNLLRGALFKTVGPFTSSELAEILNATGFSTSERAVRRWRQKNG